MRVDRTELSKNIVRGLLAYRELLRAPPGVARPGRAPRVRLPLAGTTCPSTASTPRAVQRCAEEIEDEFGTDDWEPLILNVNDDYPRSLAAYRLADVLLVNPIRDGMNLVAKEGPVLSPRGRAGAVARGRRGGRARRGRAHGQPVRRLRHGRRAARGPVDARGRAREEEATCSPPRRPRSRRTGGSPAARRPRARRHVKQLYPYMR